MTSQVFKFHLELYVTLLTVVLILILLCFMRLAKAIALLPPLVGSSLGSWKCVCVSEYSIYLYICRRSHRYLHLYIKQGDGGKPLAIGVRKHTGCFFSAVQLIC